MYFFKIPVAEYTPGAQQVVSKSKRKGKKKTRIGTREFNKQERQKTKPPLLSYSTASYKQSMATPCSSVQAIYCLLSTAQLSFKTTRITEQSSKAEKDPMEQKYTKENLIEGNNK